MDFVRPGAMGDTLRPPSLQVSVPKDAPAYSDGGNNAVSDGSVRSSSSTPTLRRKRFKMRRMRNVPSERENTRTQLTNIQLTARSRSSSKEYLQLPSIEITPSSDEDAPSSWSRCSTPSASPRRRRFLLRRWLKVREKKEQGSESRLVWAHSLLHIPSSPFIYPNTFILFLHSTSANVKYYYNKERCLAAMGTLINQFKWYNQCIKVWKF